jgi:hypothetical protein
MHHLRHRDPESVGYLSRADEQRWVDGAGHAR